MDIRVVAFITAGLLGALILLAIALRMPFTRSRRWPLYQKRLMTRAEQTLYFRMVNALPDHIVVAKVHLESFLGVKNGFRSGNWTRRISGLTADFLVCTRDARIVLAIDLDGNAPEPAKRAAENERKSLALASADIKLVRWHIRSLPTDTEICQMLICRVRHVGPVHESEPGGATGTPAPDPDETSYVPLSHRPTLGPNRATV